MKRLATVLAACALAGCINSPMAIRGVVYFNQQKPSTEGTATYTPSAGNTSIEAAKSTELNPNVTVEKEAKQ